MAKKPIEVFSISFLDLLSGALGAVIILFVFVPKMSQKEKDMIGKLGLENIAANDFIRLIVGDSLGLIGRIDSAIFKMDSIRQHMDSLKNKLQKRKENIDKGKIKIYPFLNQTVVNDYWRRFFR
jgi:hypothetical protein